MSVVRTRWVVLDDDTPAFSLSGPWQMVSDSSSHLGTLRTTTGPGTARIEFNGALFPYAKRRKPRKQLTQRFNLTGTEIILFGKAATSEGRSPPVVSCTVDGTPTTSDDRATGEFFACAWKGDASLAPNGTPHSFLLNVSSVSEESSFSIDALWYLPALNGGPLYDQRGLIEYDHNDPDIDYTSGNWEPLEDDGGNAVVATQAGSSITVILTGTKIAWEGWRPAGYGSERSSGTYWIDSGPPVVFDIDPSSGSTVHGIKLFQVDGLSSETPHNLTVVYNGPSAPLVLDHLLVQGGDFRIMSEGSASSSRPILPSTTTATASGSSTPSSPAANSDDSNNRTSAGPIVGGVIGGLAFLLLAAFAFIYARRRKRKQLSHPSTILHTPTAIPPSSLGTPVTPRPQSAWTTTTANATAASPTYSSSASQSQHQHSHLSSTPTIYRKGQVVEQPHPDGGAVGGQQRSSVIDEAELVHRHEDSGVRLTRRTSLPPLYTRD